MLAHSFPQQPSSNVGPPSNPIKSQTIVPNNNNIATILQNQPQGGTGASGTGEGSTMQDSDVTDRCSQSIASATAQRQSRKRKSPPAGTPDITQTPPQQMQQHSLPPPHTLVHPPPLPHGYQYATADYTPGGMPPQPQPMDGQGGSPDSQGGNGQAGRPLSSSKRAEQNRKAQRAFRERRDQFVYSYACSIRWGVLHYRY